MFQMLLYVKDMLISKNSWFDVVLVHLIALMVISDLH